MKQTSEITKAILQYLNQAGFHVWRQNNTRAARNRIFTGEYGVSDIIGYSKMDGARFIAVEVKIGKDRLSTEQAFFLDEVNQAGGIAIVAQDSFDDFLKKFKAIK